MGQRFDVVVQIIVKPGENQSTFSRWMEVTKSECNYFGSPACVKLGRPSPWFMVPDTLSRAFRGAGNRVQGYALAANSA